MDKSDVLLGIIDDRCRKALKEANIPSKIVGTVVKVDSKNKKIDVKIAGYDTVFTLLNKSGEILSEGDNVFVESIKDNLTNGYISERFGEARWIESNGLPEGGSTGQVLAKKSNNNNDTEWVDQTGQGGATGDTLPIGAVVEFASNNIPENWLLCNGQAVSRTTYSELFAVIGTTWGAGNGSTTFNVPTKEGLVTVGKKTSDSDFNTLGKTGGSKTRSLTVANLAKHKHDIVYIDPNADTTQKGVSISHDTSGSLQTLSIESFVWGNQTANRFGGGSNNIFAAYEGTGSPFSIVQPYTTSNFIIKAKQSAGVVATVVDNLNSTSTTDALSAKQGKILNDKIADTGWVNLTLSNGWENLGGNYPPAQYRKIGKQVFLRGLIKNNSSNTTMLLNLDSSIKPLKTNYTIVTESDVVKSAYVEASGIVNIASYTKGNWVNLGNISYFID